MINENVERLRTHNANLRRYRRLLATRLSDVERAYIARRMNEERRSVEALMCETFPDRLSLRMERGQEKNLEIAELLHPAEAFGHPMDVVEDCDLTLYEKRAILSSWAADVCAVKDAAEPNQTMDEAVGFDDIVDALRFLETDSSRGKPESSKAEGQRFWKNNADDSRAL